MKFERTGHFRVPVVNEFYESTEFSDGGCPRQWIGGRQPFAAWILRAVEPDPAPDPAPARPDTGQLLRWLTEVKRYAGDDVDRIVVELMRRVRVQDALHARLKGYTVIEEDSVREILEGDGQP